MRSPARFVLATALLAPAYLSAGASATIFYSNNFEQNEPYAEWSSNQRYTDAPVFTQFLGRYTNAGVTLTLAAPPRPRDEVPGGGGDGEGGGGGGPPPPPPPRQYLLEFWFYCIDSWDGSEPTHGPDYFGVRVNGAMVFAETFANQHTYQSYPHSPDVGRALLGFDARWNDSIYYMSIPFATDASTLGIEFLASGLNGAMNDESWGIDNVRVSTVPGPAGVSLLGVAGAFAARRRRVV
jgi:MYXO-CTERM domain-containing protein